MSERLDPGRWPTRWRGAARMVGWLLLALLSSVVSAGCAGDGDDAPAAARSADRTGPLRGAITVSAAASLTDVFSRIGAAFTDANPGTDVEFNFGSSGQLAEQLVQGVPADVAAFADTAPMDTLASDSLLAAPAEVFATNQLVIVTRPGNPERVTAPADLAGVRTLSLCVETAPCGTLAARLLADAGVVVEESRVNRGQDVRATLAAVAEGDADAAVVYVTDARAAGDAVEVVPLARPAGLVAAYPIAALSASGEPRVAAAFVAFVLGPDARRLLRAAGFGLP